MNKDRLLEVREKILVNRRRFQYAYLVTVPGENRRQFYCARELIHNCDTVGCVAGWTCAIYKPNTTTPNMLVHAADALDLSDAEAGFLMLGHAGFGESEVVLHLVGVNEALNRIDILLSMPAPPPPTPSASG